MPMPSTAAGYFKGLWTRQHTVYSRPCAALSSSLSSLMSEGDSVLTDLGVVAAARELHRRY